MRINGLNNQSFGKIYANKKDLEKEVKKINPNTRNLVRRAIKQANEFKYYDLHIENGKVMVFDKNFDEPIMSNPISEKDNGKPFYKALSYLYKKESLDDLCEAFAEHKKTSLYIDTVSRIYKKMAMSGVLEEFGSHQYKI